MFFFQTQPRYSLFQNHEGHIDALLKNRPTHKNNWFFCVAVDHVKAYRKDRYIFIDEKKYVWKYASLNMDNRAYIILYSV